MSGILVGLGTAKGSGCTSGHGICGLSRLSKRSLTAVATFMGTGALTANLLQANPALAQHFWVPSHAPHSATGHVSGPIALLLAAAVMGWAVTRTSPASKQSRFAWLGGIASGLTFGLGLMVAGMSNAFKVLHFLRLPVSGAPDWDPSLMFVMAGAIAVGMPIFSWVQKHMKKPLAAEQFHLPGCNAVTVPLVVGSALFGMGWGLGGVCPGPGIVMAGSGHYAGWLWMLAASLGWKIAEHV